MKRPWVVGLGIALLAATATEPGAWAADLELVTCRKIWDAAPHNAFTDLLRHAGEWRCVFREGTAHVSPDGAVRVLGSRDGREWTSLAQVKSARGDLRDPKLVEMPDGQLMLTAAAAIPKPSAVSHVTLAWFSRDGRSWGDPVEIGEPNFWLWRVTWRRRFALAIGYDTKAEGLVRLYRSDDGRRFEVLVPTLFDRGQPNETSIVFEPDETAICLLRRDGDSGSGQVGRSKPPYREWEWKDLGVKIGGPHLVRLSDGRYVAAVRLYDGKVRTALAWLDPGNGRLTEFLELPSGGDSSYAGLAWHADRLWVSYYSSHEGKTSIYFAEVKLP